MSRPASRPDDEFLYVDTPEGLAQIVSALAETDVVAVDTEADGMHSFYEKVCLIQIATGEGEAFVLDPLAFEDLKSLEAAFASRDLIKIFHGADFDVVGLKRDFSYSFGSLFDTMVASTLLGDDKMSLRDLVERFFGDTLEKAYTRCDWGKRPLSREQLAYSYLDVAYLVELMEIQNERLEEADLLEEAWIEFDRLCLREPGPREPDPLRFWRMKGFRNLEPLRQAIVSELFTVRERHARKLDRPVFKVVNNEALLRIAHAEPQSTADLRAMKGVSSYVASRMGRDLVQAVRRGIEKGTPPPKPKKAPDPRKRMGMAGQKRLARLREWRNDASESSGRTTMAILPNYAMMEVARLRPTTLDELAAIEGVGPKRADRWGKAILGRLG